MALFISPIAPPESCSTNHLRQIGYLTYSNSSSIRYWREVEITSRTTLVDAISLRVDHREAFYLPFILRGHDENGTDSAGVTVILHDLTKLSRHLPVVP